MIQRHCRSLTGYRGLDSRFTQDYAGAFSNPASAGFIGITNFAGADIVQSNVFTQELQLVGDIGKSFDYVAGLYYFDEHANHIEDVTIGIPLFAPGAPLFFPFSELDHRVGRRRTRNQRPRTLQGTYKVNDRLSLTAGGRYTKDDRSASRLLQANRDHHAAHAGWPAPVPSPLGA